MSVSVASLHLAVLPLSDELYAPEAGVLRGFHARTAVAGRFMAIVAHGSTNSYSMALIATGINVFIRSCSASSRAERYSPPEATQANGDLSAEKT